MPIYDVAMVIVLVAAVWFGYRKGLAWQIASVASLIVSYIVAYKFREPVAQFIQAEPPWNKIGAMLILFLGTSLLIWTIYARINKSLKKAELKGFDRQAGALLGAVKGGLICMVITMFAVSLLGDRAHQAVHSSKIGPWVEKGIWQVSAIVPPEIAKYVDPHVQKYKEQTGHTHNQIVGGQGELLNGQPTNGTYYPAETTISQNPNHIPPRQNAYSGEVQWQNHNHQYQSNQNQYSGSGNQYNNQNSGQANWNQGWGQTQQTPTNPSAGGTNVWDDLNISEASREMLESARQQGMQQIQGAIESAARQAIENATGGQQR